MTLYPSAEIDATMRRMLPRVFALHTEIQLEKEAQLRLVLACAARLLPSAHHKKFDEAYHAMGRRWMSKLDDDRNVPGYLRACDALLQKMAADPGLPPPAGQP